jgi:DNA-binding protein YbaB
MFDKLKQLNQLRQIQKTLEAEILTHEKNNIRVTIDGKMTIKDLTLDPNKPAHEQAGSVKDCINEAMEKMQRLMAQKMAGLM